MAFVDVERAQAGPRGAFPVRFPIGFIGGIILSILLVPAWWKLGELFDPVLPHFYLSLYGRTLADSWHKDPHKLDPRKPYSVVVTGSKKDPVLVTEMMLEAGPGKVRLQTVSMDPTGLHQWLLKSVYGGDFFKTFWVFVLLCMGTFTGACIGGSAYDLNRRRSARFGVHRRGARLVSAAEFNREMNAAGPGIEFQVSRFESIRIAEDLLAYHFNIFGTTGMGKSTIIRRILYQIIARGETAVILDPKGEYLAEFYDSERGDIIFDPTDARCVYWAMEEEAADEANATPWAQAFWPDEPRSSPFFKRHPRNIFAFLMSRFSVFNEPENPATCATLGFWLTHPREHVAKRIKGTEHAVALGGKNTNLTEMSQSLYTTLGEIAKPLRMMPGSPEGRTKFTVREWCKSRKGIIFLTSDPMTEAAVLPLHSAIIDMLILGTQQAVIDGSSKLPRCWFILDEVADLQRLPQLESGATKQRASGNPIILGFQDQAQFIKRYGDEGARTILGQAFTNIVLRAGHPVEARMVEQVIGHEEIERVTENRPVHLLGAHNRGRSWSSQVADSAVVTADEIHSLPRFRGYITQEGLVVKFAIQNLPRQLVTGRIERIIPPLIFREAPETDGAVAVSVASASDEDGEEAAPKAVVEVERPAAVDDVPPVVPPPPAIEKPLKKKRKNPLVKDPKQMELE